MRPLEKREGKPEAAGGQETSFLLPEEFMTHQRNNWTADKKQQAPFPEPVIIELSFESRN